MWMRVAFVGLTAACSSTTGLSASGNSDASVTGSSRTADDGGHSLRDGGPRATMDALAAGDANAEGDPNQEWAREARVRELVKAARLAGATCGTTAYPPVAPVAFNSLLAQAARAHSNDMCARQYFDHNDPSGKTPFDRIKAAGYKYSAAGENIAAGQVSPEAVMDGWMSSEGHCKNIMNSEYRELGVGYGACTDKYIHYWTQNFGATP